MLSGTMFLSPVSLRIAAASSPLGQGREVGVAGRKCRGRQWTSRGDDGRNPHTEDRSSHRPPTQEAWSKLLTPLHFCTWNHGRQKFVDM